MLLKNFRNYADESFEFTPGLNVLFGRNAQGKTNCAEAVFYLCTGTSPRARRDKQLIKSGEVEAGVSAVCAGRYGDMTLSAVIRENGRELRVNGNKIVRNADLLGNLYAVFFSPHELRLIQDGPDERRRFLNISLSQLSRPYYIALTRYNRILEQRNNLLKNRDVALVYDTLPVWDEQLCAYAAAAVYSRVEQPESTRTVDMPLSMPEIISVSILSPIITAVLLSVMPARFRAYSIIFSLSLRDPSRELPHIWSK